MSAATVEARPTAGKRATVRSAAPARTPMQIAFEGAADGLEVAANVELRHAQSGDSDILLRIAAETARRAAESGSTDAVGPVYEISALIKASRLVPGDVEDKARQSAIAAAAVDLASLIDCTPLSIVDAGADRPVPRPHAQAQRATTADAEDARIRNLDAVNALTDNFYWLGGLLATIMCMHDGDIAKARLPSPAHRRALVRHAFSVATRAHAIATKVGTIRNRVDLLEELAFASAALAALHSSFEDGQGEDTFFGDEMVCGLVGAAGNCLERAKLWLHPLDAPFIRGTDPFFVEDRRPEAQPDRGGKSS